MKTGCRDCEQWCRECEELKKERDRFLAAERSLKGSLGAASARAGEARRVAALILWFNVSPEEREHWVAAYPWLPDALAELGQPDGVKDSRAA